ncbi:MAG: hypothetical protein DWQ06_10820 [Calditrichaeota bacterium]|nr:MAG: hypothetical protein DWQ06_10820 [Calditrichota bacterium]
MNVFILPKADGEFFLFANAPEIEETLPVRFNKIKKMFNEFEKKSAKKHPTSKTIQDLDKINEISVFYPSEFEDFKAREVYQNLIKEEIEKNQKLFYLNGALLPFSIILTVLPAPNFVFYYLIWKTVSHYKTQVSGNSVQNKMRVLFVADKNLDILKTEITKKVNLSRKYKIKEIGEELEIPNLDELYGAGLF